MGKRERQRDSRVMPNRKRETEKMREREKN